MGEARADGKSRQSNGADGAMATLPKKGPPAENLRARFFRVGHRGIGPIHAKIGGYLEEARADGKSRQSNRADGAMATLPKKGPPDENLRARFFRVGHRGIGPIHAKIGGIWERPAPTANRGNRTAPTARWQP